jgi:hypothetical protein
MLQVGATGIKQPTKCGKIEEPDKLRLGVDYIWESFKLQKAQHITECDR